ncbi:unnamed protein product [Amoebophrya sp. A25]|nr:unnamed protein product [Amoebophrya sp. A25]|eukprot:GSA25T00000659001.1
MFPSGRVMGKEESSRGKRSSSRNRNGRTGFNKRITSDSIAVSQHESRSTTTAFINEDSMISISSSSAETESSTSRTTTAFKDEDIYIKSFPAPPVHVEDQEYMAAAVNEQDNSMLICIDPADHTGALGGLAPPTIIDVSTHDPTKFLGRSSSRMSKRSSTIPTLSEEDHKDYDEESQDEGLQGHQKCVFSTAAVAESLRACGASGRVRVKMTPVVKSLLAAGILSLSIAAARCAGHEMMWEHRTHIHNHLVLVAPEGRSMVARDESPHDGTPGVVLNLAHEVMNASGLLKPVEEGSNATAPPFAAFSDGSANVSTATATPSPAARHEYNFWEQEHVEQRVHIKGPATTLQ